MNQTITALEAALNAAAPTQELWIEGQDAYKKSQQTDPGNDEKAYNAALNAAAPDADFWLAGERALVLNGGPALSARTSKRFIRTKNYLNEMNNKKGDEHWSAKAGPTLAVRLLIFGIGVLIFLILRPIVVVPYDTTFGAPSGIVAAILLFVLFAVACYVTGEALVRKARRKSAHPSPTES